MAYVVKSVGYFAHWKVNGNYLDQNEPLHTSETFKVAMWKWRIMISRFEGANNISLYPMEYNYKIAGGLNPPIASFQIRIFDTIGEQSQILATSEEVRDWQFNLSLGRGTFSWRCDIELPESYYIEVEFSSLQSSNTANGESFYFNGYKRYKLSSHDPLIQGDKDTTIYVDASNQTIMAHKIALGSKSSVFKQMFTEEFIDTITISDMATVPCQKFIDYFYDIVRDEDLLNYSQDLLEAARKYAVIDLIKDIEKRLIRDITTQNVFERMKIAYRFELMTLRDQCARLLVEFKKLRTVHKDFSDFLRTVDKGIIWEIFADFNSVATRGNIFFDP